MTNPDNVGGLLPCPFCGDNNLGHKADCYLALCLLPDIPPPAVMEAAWNRRAELCRAAPAGGDENGPKVEPTLDMRGRLTFDVAAAVKNGQFADEIEGSRKLGEMLRKRRALSVDRIWLADLAWIADNIANMTPGVAQESLRKIRDTIDARLAEEDRDKPKDSAPAGSGEVEDKAAWLERAADKWEVGPMAINPADALRLRELAALLRKLQQGADYVAPELPERDLEGVYIDGHSDEQMRAYGEQCAAGVAQFMQGQRRDARRYRWLRETLESAKGSASVEVNAQLAYYEDVPAGENVLIQWYPDTPVGFHAVYGKTLDEAVDSAIAASQGQEGGHARD